MDLNNLAETIRQAATGAARDGISFLLALTQAIVVAALATYVARVLHRRIVQGLRKTAVDRNAVALAANLSVVGVYVLAATLVLALFGASWTALLTVLGASTVALSLALQDLLKSYVAGIYLLLERPFVVGDHIRIQNVEGVVEGIELRTTALRTLTGESVLVPNATVFAEIVTNRSTSPDDRTTVVLKGITKPLDEVPEALTSASAGVTDVSRRPPAIDILTNSPAGTDVSVTVFHPPAKDAAARLLTRLRELFPDADLIVERN